MILFLNLFLSFFLFLPFIIFCSLKRKNLFQLTKNLSFSWNTGQWKTSEFIPFQWIEEQPPPLYEWIDSLSYFTVESWVLESTAERTSLSTLSSLNCQHNFTSSTLNWLVCDCLSDGMEGLLFFLFFFSLSFFFSFLSFPPLFSLILILFFLILKNVKIHHLLQRLDLGELVLDFPQHLLSLLPTLSFNKILSSSNSLFLVSIFFF